jgi:alkanesulfonate monooxygenase SsuD/methylene tetrahydromethanopterin reductase-like flavin-dependent oxidoreductase (luciferase family)
MIGAFRPKMLALAARYADWWNASSTGPERYGRMAAELDRACISVGRDPQTIRRTWIGGVACAATRAAAEARAGVRVSASNDSEDYGFVGTPDDIARQMEALVAVGVDYFMLDVVDFPRLDGLKQLVREVLPQLRGS